MTKCFGIWTRPLPYGRRPLRPSPQRAMYGRRDDLKDPVDLVSVTFTLDGTAVLAASAYGSLHVYDVATADELGTPQVGGRVGTDTWQGCDVPSAAACLLACVPSEALQRRACLRRCHRT